MYNKEVVVKQIVEHFGTYCQVHPNMLRILYDVSFNCDKGVIVEIGSNKGCSTSAIASGIRDSGRNTLFYSIDPHNAGGTTEVEEELPLGVAIEEDFRVLTPKYINQGISHDVWATNINALKLAKYVTPIILYSEEAYAQFKKQGNIPNIGAIFIDADHRYHFVKTDAEMWVPHVVEDGIIIFDDATYLGVVRIINELLDAKLITPLSTIDFLGIEVSPPFMFKPSEERDKCQKYL